MEVFQDIGQSIKSIREACLKVGAQACVRGFNQRLRLDLDRLAVRAWEELAQYFRPGSLRSDMSGVAEAGEKAEPGDQEEVAGVFLKTGSDSGHCGVFNLDNADTTRKLRFLVQNFSAPDARGAHGAEGIIGEPGGAVR